MRPYVESEDLEELGLTDVGSNGLEGYGTVMRLLS